MYIEEGQNIAIRISVWSISSKEHQEMLKLRLTDLADKVLVHLPGFLAVAIQTSTDGTSMVVYEQWISEEDATHAWSKNAETKRYLSKCEAIAMHTRQSYTMVHVVSL